MRGITLLAATFAMSCDAQDPTPEPQPTSKPAHKHTNRLAKETSPYLLQHKHNPVDWYPWGKEALEKAKKENKPIFLSIGYSACHWCHVMERESFENEAIAKVMNKHFICIKVDREERPDLDDIYMSAVQALTGSGGWPMSVWMTPELKPFYGGTYFPPKDDPHHGRPGFPRVCEALGEAWQKKRKEVEGDAKRLSDHLRTQLAPKLPAGAVTRAMLDGFLEHSARHFDPEHKGFSTPPRFAPKFPHASELAMLLRHHVRNREKNVAAAGQALEMATATLTRMAHSGMYDQLGGGFHRYSVDREWLVPHFEKMLYDNALLIQVYAEAHRVTDDADFLRIVRECADYLLREMQDAKGGIWSTQDADSEGVEGKFFIWTPAEVKAVLGEDKAAAAVLHWGITEQGNWHEMPGRTVLQLARSAAQVAKQLGRKEDDVARELAASREALLAARKKRIPPGTDDKVLAAWNGMAIAAFAQAFKVSGDERYLKAAQRAADFVLTAMRTSDGRLHRTWRHGRARLNGYLDDHAFVADGLLHLFECDFDPRWLTETRALLEVLRKHYLDPKDGSFFFCADDHEKLIARNKSVQESSTPSGVAMAVLAFQRCGLLLGNDGYLKIADRAVRAHKVYLERYPTACPTLVVAADLQLSDVQEIVVCGDPKKTDCQAMLATLRRRFPADFVVAVLHAGNRTALQKLSPTVFGGKQMQEGKATAYVCRRGVCEKPVTTLR